MASSTRTSALRNVAAYDRTASDEVGTILDRFASDSGAISARLCVRGVAGDCVLASYGPEAVEDARTSEMVLDRHQGDVLILAATFAVVDLPQTPEALMQRGMHPATAAFFRTWWRGERNRLRSSELAATLDRSIHGWILLDEHQQILWTNRKADQLLNGSSAIRRSALSIAAATMADTLALRAALSRAATETDGPRKEGLRISRSEDGEPLTLLISSVPIAEGGVCRTVLQIIDPMFDLRPSVAIFSRLLRLSSAEGRIVAEMLQGSSLVVAADRLGIKLSTARSQLKSIFIKTRVATQAELVRLFLIAMPTIMEEHAVACE